MATEEPSTVPLKQTETGPASPTPIEEMAIDVPAAQAVNGHAKSDNTHGEPPATNGAKEISPSKDPQESAKSTLNHEAFALNKNISEASAAKPTAAQSISEDVVMEGVNGTAEDTIHAKESETTPSAGTAPESKSAPTTDGPEATAEATQEIKDTAVEGVTDATPADAMDVDASTERPDPTASAEHVDSTQNTSTMEVDLPKSTAQDTTQSADLSKLDIKASQDSDAISPTQDTSMVDSGVSSAKIPRDREDDTIEEPAAKRAKTEERTETVVDTLVVATNQLPAASSTQSPVEAADSAVPDDHQITQFQNKRIREVLGNVKKTKNGGNFRKSVKDLWPMLWQDYTNKVSNPVDISLMENRLREFKYERLGQLKADLKQLYENAVTFNGPVHEVAHAARAVREYVLIRLPDIIQQSEPPNGGQKGKPQPTRHTEPRAATQRRESLSQGNTVVASPKPKTEPSALPTPTSAAAQAFAVPPGGIPQIRRDSTRDDNDRPKRPIHPPKNRDPEYGSKASRKKKLDPEQRFFESVLEDVKRPRNFPVTQWFMSPVDPVALNIPNYFKIIRKPMDLGTMTEKNYEGEYKTVKDIEKDIKQITANAEAFNGPEHEVTYQARQLETLFKNALAGKDKWMEKNYPADAVNATAASPEHSLAESEEESDGEAEEEDNEAIRNLQIRLNEEQAKLNSLLQSKKPDLVMMEVQQSMLTVLQRRLVDEKTKFHSEKKPKPKKKSGSKAKAKPSGGATGKKASSSSKATKPTSTTKKSSAPKKRAMGAFEKAVIAEGINELDGALLTKAVEIIKRDTGQNENDDGEMELDIDSLTSDALVKLFDLITKAHPNIVHDVEKRPEFANMAPPEIEQKAKSSGGLPKTKKNKPMNKHEQEKKIEQLRELKAQLQRGGSGSQEPLPGAAEEPRAGESSEESDSEEE